MDFDLPASHLLSIHPGMFFFAVVLFLWSGTLLGGYLRRKRETRMAEETSTFKTLEGAVLALLGLLLGFTFSMAVGRYDQRKNLEIAEANTLTNVWLRTATLPQPERLAEQRLLREYVPVRLEFLNAGTVQPRIESSLQQASQLQRQIWQGASAYAATHVDPVTAQNLSEVTAMIDVTESRTAAFENRIPILAWCMLLFIGLVASMLVGVGIGSRSRLLRFVLPLVVASALSLILDLDSPRSGLIRVHQHSLERVLSMMTSGPVP